MTQRRVAVLMGGVSAERDVSLSTGRQILGALDTACTVVTALDTADPAQVLAALTQDRPDVAFIALHGPGGEDGTVQGMLEFLHIPYTGSGVLASALAMDKAMCKRVLMSVGVRMPQDVTVRRGDGEAAARAAGWPCPSSSSPTARGPPSA